MQSVCFDCLNENHCFVVEGLDWSRGSRLGAILSVIFENFASF